MLKAWEIVRQPKLKTYLYTPLTRVRAELRNLGKEDVIPVFKSLYEEKFQGFITSTDILIVTSSKSDRRVNDVIRNYPLIPETMDVNEIFKTLKESNVLGAPVVKSISEPYFKGVITFRDIISTFLNLNIAPKAKHVVEIMKVDNIDEYITIAEERVNKVWSKFVYRGVPGLIVVRSFNERIPIGTVTLEDFINTGKWYFRREAEHMVSSITKVKRIMMRGTYVATPEVSVIQVAKVMVKQDVPIIPVINEKGFLIGIITIEDIAQAFIEKIVPKIIVPLPPVVVPIPKPITAQEQVMFEPTEKVLEQVLVTRKEPAFEIGIVAEDILKKEMPAIMINNSIEHVRKEMLKRKTNYLLVINDKDEILGFISKGNMLKAIGTRGPLWRRRIGERLFIDYVMTRSIPTVPRNAKLEDIALQMVSNEVDLVKVLDFDGSLLGFITKDNIVNALLKVGSRGLVENIMTPRRISIVHPHHSLHHAIARMKMFFLDALAVYDGKIRGIISENRLPFIAFEDAKTGIKSRRLIWIRKLVRGAERKGRYIKITPLLAIDATVRVKAYVNAKNDIKYAIELMNKFNVNGVPVVNDEGELLGIVCKNDVLRDLARSSRLMAEIEKKTKKERRMKV